MKECDKCPKFHQIANSHQRNKAIEVLQERDNILSDQEPIKKHIVNFYEKLFKEYYSWRPKLDRLFLTLLTMYVQNSWRVFEEVLDVDKGMARDKTPVFTVFQ